MRPEGKERIEQIRHGNVPEGYKKTAAGIMPITWRQVRIGDVCAVNPLRPKKQEERVTFLGMADVSEEGRLINPSIVDYTKVSKGFTPFERGDILVAKITPCFENGKGADTNALPTQQGYGSTEFHVLRCKDVDRRYMFLHTTSYEFRKKLESEMTGSAGQKRVQTESVASYLLGLPSIDEQQGIAEILTVQDKVIELKEKLLAEKQRQKKYLMQHLVSGKKRLPGFSSEWKKNAIGSFIREVDEKTTENNQYDILSVTKNGIVRQFDHFNKQVASEDNTGYKILRRGNLAFSSMNLWMGSLDVLEDYEVGIISPAYKVFSFNTQLMNIKFGRQFMRSESMIWQYKVNSKQGASIVRRNLDLKALLSTKVSIPGLDEQQAIATVLMAADREIELLQQDIEYEKKKKKALMHLLLTGIVRVSV